MGKSKRKTKSAAKGRSSPRKSITSHHRSLSFWLTVAGVVLTALAFLYAWISARDTAKILAGIERSTVREGDLKPGNLQTPLAPCPLPAPGFYVFLGSNVFIVKGNTPTTAISYRGQELLRISGGAEGLRASAVVRSMDSRIIAAIEDNRFTLNPNNYFRLDHSDPSRLAVYDQYGDLALGLHFVNSSTLRVKGTWQLPSGRSLVITDDSLLVNGGFVFEDVCLTVPASKQITMLRLN